MPFVSMPLEGGGEIVLETAEDPGSMRVGRGDHLERATDTVQDAMQRVRPAAEAVLTQFRNMEQPPSTVHIEFGIKVTGEANFAIAKASGEGNFAVTVEWKNSAS